jgi:hypothetical protein
VGIAKKLYDMKFENIVKGQKTEYSARGKAQFRSADISVWKNIEQDGVWCK